MFMARGAGGRRGGGTACRKSVAKRVAGDLKKDTLQNERKFGECMLGGSSHLVSGL